MKIKRMIKQLLCAHRWECHAVSYSEGMVSRYYQCPKCGNELDCVDKVCDECGQRIDWSEDETADD